MPDPTPTEVMLARTLRRAAQIRRRRRRLAGGGLVAVVAAFGVAVPLVALRSPGGAQVRVGATGGPAQAATTTAPAQAPAPTCPVSQLAASFDHRQDGAYVGVADGRDDDGTTLVLTNTGRRTCRVAGAPGVTLAYAYGGEAPAPTAGGREAAPVVLGPGASAGAALRWRAGCGAVPESLGLTLPGWASELTVPWTLGGLCRAEGLAVAALAPDTAPPSSQAAPAASGLCRTAQLEFVYLPGGSSRSSDPAVYSFEVVNISGRACTTGDYPGASVSDAGGSPLVVSSGRADIGGAPESITLAPGAVASFAVTLPDEPGASCNAVGAFHFIAPDDDVPEAVGVAGDGLEVCGGGSGTSAVGPLHAGLAFALDQGAG